MNLCKIIDLSYHKGILDVSAIAEAGVEINIHKLNDGFFMPIDYSGTYDKKNHIDISFVRHWAEFKEKLRRRGAYVFLRVDDELAKIKNRPTSLEQIDEFVVTINKYGFFWDDYVIIDIEQVGPEMDSVSAKQIGARIKAAVIYMESLVKRKPIIYTGAWWWEMYHHAFDNDFFSEQLFWLSDYWPIDSSNLLKYSGSLYDLDYNRCFPRLWLSDVNKRVAYCRVPVYKTPTIPLNNVLLWQYSDRGLIPGTNTKPIDVNIEIIPESEWVTARGQAPVIGEPTEPPIIVEPVPEEPPIIEPEEPEPCGVCGLLEVWERIKKLFSRKYIYK